MIPSLISACNSLSLRSALRCFAVALLLLAAVVSDLSASGGGARLRVPGEYYAGVSIAWLTAEQEFDLQGNRRGVFSDTATFSDGQFGMTDVGLFGELGITDWLSGVASTHYLVAIREARYRRSGRDTTLSSSGLGDLWLGGRVRLLDTADPLLASATLSLKIPTGSPTQSIPLGTGLIDYELVLSAGRYVSIIEGMQGYGEISAGYRLRNNVSDEFNYAIVAELALTRVLLAAIVFDGVISMADFDAGNVDPSVRALVNEQTFARWNAALRYSSSPTMELLASYNRQVVGRNSLAGSSFSIGIAWKR